MTGPTHKQFAVCGAFVAAMAINKLGLSQVNYYLAIPILLETSKYGALFPDVDHNWKNVKDKTVPNWIINKLIHLSGGKHRSWQTHSIDIVAIMAILAYYLPGSLLKSGYISPVNKEVLSIIMFGFMAGWISHIIADMLNGVGVRIVCWSKKTIAFVPKHIGNFRFNTGNEWEAFVFKVARFLNIIMGIVCIVYPAIASGQLQRLLENIRHIGGF